MPSKNKRQPIDYKPQFENALFRPKDVVEEELEQVGTEVEAEPRQDTTNDLDLTESPISIATSEAQDKTGEDKEIDQASMQESIHARMQERKNARKKSSPQEPPQVNGPLASQIIDSIWPLISEPATLTNAFRYTSQELSALTDAHYQLAKQHNVKFPKQDIVRLGLNAILWDHQVRGEDSLLSEFIKTKKRQRE